LPLRGTGTRGDQCNNRNAPATPALFYLADANYGIMRLINAAGQVVESQPSQRHHGLLTRRRA
jgi:hypothetical protein